ncbi:MAG: chorismate-binding protein [Cryomorphaceae bacterium]|nr:chorismate-binding protein [Flavobacteriales bacterium]
MTKETRQLLNEGKPFCLARFPGEEPVLFPFASETKPQRGDYFTVKGWEKDGVEVYFGTDRKGCSLLNRAVQPEETLHSIDYQTYRIQFENYQKNFQERGIQKAILSRIKRVEMPNDFDSLTAFAKACTKYPETLTYLLLHPTEGLWLGASPEILLRKRMRWKTVSLAGTQPKKDSGYTWGEKEKEEQELVSRHIREKLKSIGVTHIEESGVETTTSGAVAHLKTIFHFDTDAPIENIIAALHPTPAIAGLPVADALGLIAETETHHRRLYTGYMGRISREKVDLYVNLRCMQIVDGKLGLYLGGGITPQSKTESEWEETELKAQTLLNVTYGK